MARAGVRDEQGCPGPCLLTVEEAVDTDSRPCEMRPIMQNRVSQFCFQALWDTEFFFLLGFINSPQSNLFHLQHMIQNMLYTVCYISLIYAWTVNTAGWWKVQTLAIYFCHKKALMNTYSATGQRDSRGHTRTQANAHTYWTMSCMIIRLQALGDLLFPTWQKTNSRWPPGQLVKGGSHYV